MNDPISRLTVRNFSNLVPTPLSHHTTCHVADQGDVVFVHLCFRGRVPVPVFDLVEALQDIGPGEAGFSDDAVPVELVAPQFLLHAFDIAAVNTVVFRVEKNIFFKGH